MKELFKNLNKRPIAYYPAYAEITGSVKSGILLSQIMYWHQAMKEEPFYKKESEWLDELAMGRKEFKGAKATLEKLGLISVSVEGNKRQTFYYPEVDKIIEKIISIVPKGNNAKCQNGTLQSAKREQCTYTENTTENTQILNTANEVRRDYIAEIIFLFKDIDPCYEEWYGNKTQRSAVKWLIDKFGFEEVSSMVSALPAINAKEFVTKSTTPWELKKNLGKLKAHFDQTKSKPNKLTIAI